jgi:hypothetical protein
MSDRDKLRDFVEKIMLIQAPAQNLFGGSIPGMMGASGPANQAAETGGGDVVGKLKREVIELARMKAQQANMDDTKEQAKIVEGLLLMISTLSILTEAQVNRLLDELHTVLRSQ